MGLSRKLQTNLDNLKRFQVLLKHSLHVRRGVDCLRSSRVQWQERDSCFQSKVRTGLSINNVHKDISMFLKDAYFIDVNTLFCGEFFKIDIFQYRELKSFETMMSN